MHKALTHRFAILAVGGMEVQHFYCDAVQSHCVKSEAKPERLPAALGIHRNVQSCGASELTLHLREAVICLAQPCLGWFLIMPLFCYSIAQ